MIEMPLLILANVYNIFNYNIFRPTKHKLRIYIINVDFIVN